MTYEDLTSRSSVTLLAAFFLLAGLFAYSLRLVRVQGSSMEPNYHNGQWLLVRRLNWPRPPLRHDEVVVFRLGRDVLVKRVAALSGEIPPVDDLRLLRLLRPVVERPMWERTAHELARTLSPIPRGSLYVLGDNARNSEDSRCFGSVPESAVIGRVIQWDPPDPPEREQIGYVVPRRYQTLSASRLRGGKVLALALIAHP